MFLALRKVAAIQAEVGSKFVYVECENKRRLVNFYKRHGFVEFGRRTTERKSESNNNTLIQLLKYM